MQKTLNANAFKNFIFFATIWVFFSLNSSFLRIPNADIWRWVLLGLLILLSFVSSGQFNVQPPRIFYFFVFGVLPSLFVSIDVQESFIKFLSFIVVVWGGYIYFSSLQSKEELELALRIIMFVVIAFELFSVYYVITGRGFDASRMKGVMTNPNSLGLNSVLSFVASYFWLKTTRGVIKKVLFILLGIVSIYTAFSSASRTAFGALVICIATIILYESKGGARGVLATVIIVVFGFLLLNKKLAFININVVNRFYVEGDTRGELWEKGIQVWQEHPVFGCGYAVSKYLNDIDLQFGYYAFHNSYISLLAETGLWGMLLIGVGFIFDFYRIFKVTLMEVKNPQSNSFLACFIMMLSLMVAAYGESFLFAVGSSEACIFWMLFTWGLAYMKIEKIDIGMTGDKNNK